MWTGSYGTLGLYGIWLCVSEMVKCSVEEVGAIVGSEDTAWCQFGEQLNECLSCVLDRGL